MRASRHRYLQPVELCRPQGYKGTRGWKFSPRQGEDRRLEPGLAHFGGDSLGFGAACNPSAVPLGADVFKLNDTVDQATRPFLATFPYLNTPVPGTGAQAATAAAARSASK